MSAEVDDYMSHLGAVRGEDPPEGIILSPAVVPSEAGVFAALGPAYRGELWHPARFVPEGGGLVYGSGLPLPFRVLVERVQGHRGESDRSQADLTFALLGADVEVDRLTLRWRRDTGPVFLSYGAHGGLRATLVSPVELRLLSVRETLQGLPYS